jgi:uncharacterized protein YyaL (SSP411 family)
MTSNRLRQATSPYLQQHADNPVDWWPWCDEALELARQSDRPILLSIGYSACHWCHVMAHESFEDPATAEVMNALYVNIKVDREERPDLDKIYQTAHQLLSRRPGGWPLTVFLTPDDHTPFFAGTYFPPQPRHGLPAFVDLLRQVERAYREQRPAIEQQNGHLRGALVQLDAAGPPGEPDPRPAQTAVDQLADQFDLSHGGFGGAPKFPHPATLRFLLREGVRSGDARATEMALGTLEHMANGGIQDHLAGGFYRYSVDEFWMIPHFEKMLYDNGQLLALYAEAWQAAGHRPLFKHVCERMAEWLMNEMQAPEGGYYASLDADSEGEEGLFYLWTPEEVRSLLDPDQYRVFARRFGLDAAANFEGRWHLHTYADTGEIARATGLEPRAVRGLLAKARDRLLAARAGRVRPGRDDKILTSWNALAIKGMARAGRALERPDWIDSAARALDFLAAQHWRDGRLLASSRDGAAHLNAYLDDHAFLLDAVLEMLQSRWNRDWLTLATRLADRLLDRFADPQGGFFFTSDDHEQLVHRPRPLADEAVPSGNAVAVEALQLLAHLVGEPRYAEAAERALCSAWSAIERAPYAHIGLVEGLRQALDPPALLIVRGPEADLPRWLQAAAAGYAPGAAAFGVPAEASGLPPGLAARSARPDATLAYRCVGTHCEPPVSELAALSGPAAPADAGSRE